MRRELKVTDGSQHKVITLPSGHSVLVDAEDYGRVRIYKWWLCLAKGNGCIQGYKNKGDGLVRLNHLVLRLSNGVPVIHKNGSVLDNRKTNLLCRSRMVPCSSCKTLIRRTLSQLKTFKRHFCPQCKRGIVEVACLVCEKRFTRRKSVASKAKYCSLHCTSKSLTRQVSIPCSNCGDTFNRKPSHVTAINYCSRLCMGEHRRSGLRRKFEWRRKPSRPILYSSVMLERFLEWRAASCAFPSCKQVWACGKWHLCPLHKKRLRGVQSHRRKQEERYGVDTIQGSKAA
jgi:hypothetical protein